MDAFRVLPFLAVVFFSGNTLVHCQALPRDGSLQVQSSAEMNLRNGISNPDTTLIVLREDIALTSDLPRIAKARNSKTPRVLHILGRCPRRCVISGQAKFRALWTPTTETSVGFPPKAPSLQLIVEQIGFHNLLVNQSFPQQVFIGGPAIGVEDSNVTIIRCAFTNNAALSAGGVSSLSGHGGAVAVTKGTLRIEKSTLIGNTAGTSGGAVFADPTVHLSAEVDIVDSILSRNKAPWGGALAVSTVTLTVNRASFIGNKALGDAAKGLTSLGGAVYIQMLKAYQIPAPSFQDVNFTSNVAFLVGDRSSSGGGALAVSGDKIELNLCRVKFVGNRESPARPGDDIANDVFSDASQISVKVSPFGFGGNTTIPEIRALNGFSIMGGTCLM